jgi:hypothetical protein
MLFMYLSPEDQNMGKRARACVYVCVCVRIYIPPGVLAGANYEAREKHSPPLKSPMYSVLCCIHYIYTIQNLERGVGGVKVRNQEMITPGH